MRKQNVEDGFKQLSRLAEVVWIEMLTMSRADCGETQTGKDEAGFLQSEFSIKAWGGRLL